MAGIDSDFGGGGQHEYSPKELKALHCVSFKGEIERLRAQGLSEAQILSKLFEPQKPQIKKLKVKPGYCIMCGGKKVRRFKGGKIKDVCGSRRCEKLFYEYRKQRYNLPERHKKYYKTHWQKLKLDPIRYEDFKKKSANIKKDDELKRKQKLYRARPEVKARRQFIKKVWYEKNLGHIKIYSKIFYRIHRKRILEYQKSYRAKIRSQKSDGTIIPALSS